MIWSFGFVLPVILVFAVIIPLALAILMYSSKNSLIRKKKYIFMTGEYNPRAWFWEFVKMYVKLLIMCCLTFLEQDITNKVNFWFYWKNQNAGNFLKYLNFFDYCFIFVGLFSDIAHFPVGGLLWVSAELFQALQARVVQQNRFNLNRGLRSIVLLRISRLQ